MYKTGLEFNRQRTVERTQESPPKQKMSPLAQEAFSLARQMNMGWHDDGDPHYLGSQQ